MSDFIKVATAEEHIWLVNILMQDLKAGFQESTVWPAFHEQAAEFYHRNTNLETLCKTLFTRARVDLVKIEVGQCCSVMLAQNTGNKIKWNNPESTFGELPYLMEVKWDGERIHLHKNRSTCHYFSRNCYDFTDAYNVSDPKRSHWKNIQEAFINADICILDGEMIGYDTRTQTYVTKDDNLDVKALGKDTATIEKHPNVVQCYLVWDMIYLNGEPLYDKPLHERRRLLLQHIKPIEGRLHIPEIAEGHSVDDFIKYANQALEAGHEGIILKKRSSRYEFGQRRKGWWKWKPENESQLSDTLDLLIVGAYRPDGARRQGGRFSHFMLAVAERPPDDAPPGTRPSKFYSFCKVGTGYAYNELQRVRKLLDKHMKPFDKRSGPSGMGQRIELAVGDQERPDFYIEPENSIIVEVKAATIISTSKFRAGVTMRFPRVVRFRDKDKAWYDCDTVQRVSSIGQSRQMASGNLEASMLVREDKPKNINRNRRVTTIHEDYQLPDTSQVRVKSKCFKDRIFLLSTIDARNGISREEAAKLIVSMGGQVTNSEKHKVDYVVCTSKTFRLSALMKREEVDFVKPKWLKLCSEQDKVVDLRPDLVIHASQATQKAIQSSFDELGDSFHHDLTVEDFEHMLALTKSKRAKLNLPSVLNRATLADIENDMCHAKRLRHCVIYFDTLYDPSAAPTGHNVMDYSPLQRLAVEAELCGAEVSEVLDEHVTHVIVDESDLERVASLRLRLNELHDFGVHVPILRNSWLVAALADEQEPGFHAYELH
eukprot:TRINITY_DN7989_c0_g1_i1.p1 TRINITY_DN7989_c0_g1~~TRINITY_DN7989_c0_g1_i1.p1  ORF type:complete len:780 (+),score=139.33 TRINITY_DN7989_c0_g1_i1:32-2341(+)